MGPLNKTPESGRKEEYNIMIRTKIICTMGPACENEETLESMFQAGMNVGRFNFSHGSHEEHRRRIEMFRRVRDRMGLPGAVMLDTKGPEIRLGLFENGSAQLVAGEEFTLTTEEVLGDAHRASITYKDLPKDVAVGNTILFDDGLIELEVLATTETTITCRIKNSGTIKDRKGVNVPNVRLNMPYLSERDKSDLLFGISMDVDFVAASFVRSSEDVIAMRRFLDYNGGKKILIISKIENQDGVKNFSEILDVSNGIMVARGDMGVEIAFERLPGIQKEFIKRCYQAGKVVITATQMLESMTHNPNPTRAEITDVANAVFDGTSAVMLSGESAAGDYPVRAVQTMARIVKQAETDALHMGAYDDIKYDLDATDVANAICDAACTTARDIKAKAILTVTTSGYTARRMSKFRPETLVIAATPEAKTYHQLSMSWGVIPVMAKYQPNSDLLFEHAIECAKQTGIVSGGDYVVMTAGIPVCTTGNTNVLKVERVPCDRCL